MAAMVLVGLSGALVLGYVPVQWQSHAALAGSLLILVLAIAIAIVQRRRREPGFTGVAKKVGLSVSGGLLLFVGALALLFLVLLLVLPP
jgi:high-affinity nickel permease